MNILDFETNFETVAKEFLATDLSSFTSLQFSSSLDRSNFTLPRLEINAELQGAEDPPTKDSFGRLNYSQYSLNLEIKIITDMSSDVADEATGLDPSNLHRKLREEVRTSMLLSSSNWTTPKADSVIVSGAGSSIVNGTYSKTGTLNNRGVYTKPAGASYGKIYYDNSLPTPFDWAISVEGESSEDIFYLGYAAGASFFPYDASSWSTVVDNASDPRPSVSQGYILEDYEVKYMRPAGTDYEVDGDLGISTLTYEIKFTTIPSRLEAS
jgi:hypothetical protein